MIDFFYSNINIFKAIFFLTTGFMLLPKYLNIKDKQMNLSTFFITISFVLILIHSILFSYNPIDSTIDALLALLMIVVLFLIAKTIDSKKILRFINFIFLIFSALVIVPSDLIVLSGRIDIFSHAGNFHSVFANANMLGMYLSIFITPYILSFLDRGLENKKIKKYPIYFMLLNIFYLLLLTNSRTNIIIFILCLSFYLFLKNKQFLRIKNLLIIFSIVLLGYSLFFNYFFELIFKGQTTLFTTRLPLWMLRIEAIKESPLIGWGFNVNEFTYYDKYNIFNEGEKGNFILSTIEEFGIFLGTFLIIIIFRSLFLGFKKYNSIIDKKYFGLILLLIPIHLMVETWILNFSSLLAILTWFLIINAFEIKNES